MYLSRLILNPRSRHVQRDLAEPYEMHRTLMRSFPRFNASDGSGGPRVLWRLDSDRRTGHLTVYVQSHVEPDWCALSTAHPGYVLEPEAAGVEANPVCRGDLDRKTELRPGQVLSFRLRANPSKKQPAGRKNNPRIGLVNEEEQLAWLRRKGEQGGFALASVAIAREDGPKDMAKGRKQMNGAQAKLSLLSVRFEGFLKITDPQAFRRTIFSGIGPGKAFGFGLLSIAPA